MAHILVVYGTTQGQAGKIADHLSQELTRLGHLVDLWDCRKLPGTVRPEDYDGVLVGGSVHARGFQRPLRRWVAKNATALNGRPSAFFSVCLGILQKDPFVQHDELEIVDDFVSLVEWHPKRKAIFAGALPYTRYNWFLKRIMRAISRKAGGDTDITRDFEYTNWAEVSQFARDFSSLFRATEPLRASANER